MGPDIKDVAKEMRNSMTRIDSDLDHSLSGNRGAKAAAKRIRKESLELQRLMLEYRKLSVQKVG